MYQKIDCHVKTMNILKTFVNREVFWWVYSIFLIKAFVLPYKNNLGNLNRTLFCIERILFMKNNQLTEKLKISGSSNSTDFLICFFEQVHSKLFITGSDLTTHDSYFMILFKVFTNHMLAENTYFTTHIESKQNIRIQS